jgi:hypothetical protein
VIASNIVLFDVMPGTTSSIRTTANNQPDWNFVRSLAAAQ